MFLAFVVAGVLLCAGCAQKGAQNNQAEVEKALREYLAKKGMSESMKLEVRQVQYQGDTAEASVVLTAKSNAEAAMAVTYVLKRTGPGSWQVQGRKEAGAAGGHSGGMPMPAAPEGPTPSPFGPPGQPAGQPGSATNPHGSGMPPASPGQKAPALPPSHQQPPPPQKSGK